MIIQRSSLIERFKYILLLLGRAIQEFHFCAVISTIRNCFGRYAVNMCQWFNADPGGMQSFPSKLWLQEGPVNLCYCILRAFELIELCNCDILQ